MQRDRFLSKHVSRTASWVVLRGKDDKKGGCQIQGYTRPCNLLMNEHQETHGKQFLRLERRLSQVASRWCRFRQLTPGLEALLVP